MLYKWQIRLGWSYNFSNPIMSPSWSLWFAGHSATWNRLPSNIDKLLGGKTLKLLQWAHTFFERNHCHKLSEISVPNFDRLTDWLQNLDFLLCKQRFPYRNPKRRGGLHLNPLLILIGQRIAHRIPSCCSPPVSKRDNVTAQTPADKLHLFSKNH